MSRNNINIDLLAESLVELAQMDVEIKNDMLRCCGYDPEQAANRGLQFVKKLKFQTEVALKKQRRQELWQKALGFFKQLTGNSKQELMTTLAGRGLSLQFRNLENLETEDLQQILDEATLLEIMAKIEREESGK